MVVSGVNFVGIRANLGFNSYVTLGMFFCFMCPLALCVLVSPYICFDFLWGTSSELPCFQTMFFKTFEVGAF